MRKVMMWMLTIVLVISLCGCSTKKEGIEITLSEFEYACQNLDVNAMLNCIDPDVAQPIRAALVIYELATGQDLEDIMDMIVASVFGESYDPTEFLSGLTIEEEKIKTRGAKAEAKCVIRFAISGEVFKEDAVINMIEDDDIWYISSVRLLEEK